MILVKTSTFLQQKKKKKPSPQKIQKSKGKQRISIKRGTNKYTQIQTVTLKTINHKNKCYQDVGGEYCETKT